MKPWWSLCRRQPGLTIIFGEWFSHFEQSSTNIYPRHHYVFDKFWLVLPISNRRDWHACRLVTLTWRYVTRNGYLDRPGRTLPCVAPTLLFINMVASQCRGQGCWTCGECGKELSTRGSLRRHEILHFGKRLFSCTQCRRWFRLKVDYDNHQILHMCRVCGNMFSRRRYVTLHMRNVHGLLNDGSLRPYKQASPSPNQ
jgi:hypothetical protein